MPRILLSAAHVSTLVLNDLGMDYSKPKGAAQLPLPGPFLATPERIDRLQSTDVDGMKDSYVAKCKASSTKPFCNDERSKGSSSTSTS
ncbi:FAD dependent oxidoreductase [Geosmithia morbida]|uniref:FAD dependent oxidoreductase n=1 Tax=Geosmithia morbida TaxID=1094350 RepID=A0A9P4YY48_9HYPO|nr:FAD dependent oxidoreductase [Geosmithia morbida]KAF4123823.1 FAD dependent oxidoreductase [Geosmithia morbida]